jgi:hypothetical protein
MRYLVTLVAGLFLCSPPLRARQPGPQATPAPEPPVVVYRIDLNPTGTGFAMNEPKLEGDVYVFYSLPERTLSRLPKERVKKISRRSNDLRKEVLWQIDLEPTGRILSSKEPVKKGSGYVLTELKQGTLMSVRKTDVRKITRLAGIDAFRAELEETGAALLPGELPPGAGTGTARGASPGPAAAPTPGAKEGPGNWTYEGKPGVTDAWAPPSAVQSRPGDVPKAAPTKPPK